MCFVLRRKRCGRGTHVVLSRSIAEQALERDISPDATVSRLEDHGVSAPPKRTSEIVSVGPQRHLVVQRLDAREQLVALAGLHQHLAAEEVELAVELGRRVEGARARRYAPTVMILIPQVEYASEKRARFQYRYEDAFKSRVVAPQPDRLTQLLQVRHTPSGARASGGAMHAGAGTLGQAHVVLWRDGAYRPRGVSAACGSTRPPPPFTGLPAGRSTGRRGTPQPPAPRTGAAGACARGSRQNCRLLVPNSHGDAERGAKVAALAGGCGCHSEKAGPQLAGGKALVTPAGTFYSTNITNDPNEGVGAWSAYEIEQAIRAGVLPDGSVESPAMPYYR